MPSSYPFQSMQPLRQSQIDKKLSFGCSRGSLRDDGEDEKAIYAHLRICHSHCHHVTSHSSLSMTATLFVYHARISYHDIELTAASARTVD